MQTKELDTNTETMFPGVENTHGWTGYTKKSFPEVETPLELLVTYRNYPGFKRLCIDNGVMYNTYSKSIVVILSDGIVLVTQNDDDTVTCIQDGVELSTKSKFDLAVASEKHATLLDVEARIMTIVTTLQSSGKIKE